MKRQKGFVIPLSLCVAGVVLFLGASTAQLCAGDLQVASHEYYQERARQVADFTLESGVAGMATLSGSYSYNGVSSTHPDDIGLLTIYNNRDGNHPKDPGCPVVIPAGYEYWVAEGQARNGPTVLGRVRVGAMVQIGQPLGSAGAQIRYLSVDDLNGPVTYLAKDKFNAVVANKVICATSARDSTLPFPTPPAQVKPLSFHQVANFAGILRIPQGSSYDTLTEAETADGLPLHNNPSGGVFNIPAYSPPTPAAVYGLVAAPPGYSNLSPGEYAEVSLGTGSSLNLRGSYHIRKLTLTGAASPYPGALVGPESGAVDIYVDEIVNPSNLSLGLYNLQQTADAYRFNLKPPRQGAPPQMTRLSVRVSPDGTGGVSVVAPGQTVDVTGETHRLIRGSIACELLSLHFKNSGGLGDTPTFVYDTTADQSRSSHTSGGSELNGMGTPEFQPMILSKNPLP